MTGDPLGVAPHSLFSLQGLQGSGRAPMPHVLGPFPGLLRDAVHRVVETGRGDDDRMGRICNVRNGVGNEKLDGEFRVVERGRQDIRRQARARSRERLFDGARFGGKLNHHGVDAEVVLEIEAGANEQAAGEEQIPFGRGASQGSVTR